MRKRLGDAQTSSSLLLTETKKACFRDRYGCVSWQPPVEEEDSLREKQNQLKALALSIEYDKKCVLGLMTETYGLQRMDINSGRDAPALKEMWPFLFTDFGIITHVRLLTEIDLSNTMMVAFSEKATSLVSFFRSQNKKVGSVCRRLDEAKEVLKNETPTFIGVVLLLMAYFNEAEDTLFVVKDVSIPTNRIY